MSSLPVRIEWRKGVNGNLGTYVFYPKPSIHRPSSGGRTAIQTVPLLDGVMVQNLGRAERTLELAGVLYNKTNNWDDMETSRNNLINGLGIGPGQLHLISPQRHVRYDGQITTEGIQFDSQLRSNYQDYTIRIIVPNALEINVTETTRTILSDTTVI
jgi:hypothetical protein